MTLVAALVALLAAGCSMSPDEDSPTVAYRKAESAKSLEVPPDLTRPESTGAIDLTGGGGDAGTGDGLLPEFERIRFVRAGVNSWLEMDQVAPADVWPRVDGFLRSQGLSIARREPTLGIVETEWAERLDSPGGSGIGGFINNLIGGLGSSDIRDKYVIRLERMEGGSGTRVFVTHRSAQEVDTRDSSNNRRQMGDYVWARRAADPAIEAEMTRRLLVHLGVSEPGAEGIVADAVDALSATPRYVVDGGTARVMLDDMELRRVFVRIGDALGDIGAGVRSADAGGGVYVLDWVPPADVDRDGGLFGLFGPDEDEPVELQVQMEVADNAVRIKAADAEGVQRSGPVHRALLRQLAVALGADPETVEQAEAGDTGTVPESGPPSGGD